MNKHLPIILFAICILIAVVLAVTLSSLWPAALAIAIAGAALALALRLYTDDESTDFSSEIAELQKTNENLRADIEKTNEVIEELADVIEQIAAASANDANTFQPLIDGLRTDVVALQTENSSEPDFIARFDELPVLSSRVDGVNSRVDDVNLRLVAIEDRMNRQVESHDGTLNLTDTLSTPSSAVDMSSANVGDVRSLIARAGGATGGENTEGQGAEESNASEMPSMAVPDVSLAPVFNPDLGAPVAFILSMQSAEIENAASVLLRHAIQVSTELEEAGRPILLLVRMSPEMLSDVSVRNEILTAIGTSHALQLRLTVLTQQHGFDAAARDTLAALAEHGCKFAMEEVRDWSLDLAGMATSGMRFIIVDALAMANSAREQGGDPRRLAQALAMHDIALIGGAVASKDDMETVRTLEPALVTGDGLGPARVLEPTT